MSKDGAVEAEGVGFPKRLLSCPWGLLKENRVEDVALMLVFGGGPAGVVELANREFVGLLVGVVVDAVFEPRLNRGPPPVFEVAPNNGLGVSA